jgi:hypothetical protein
MNQKFNPVSITTSADDILKITRHALAYPKEVPEYWRTHCEVLATGLNAIFFNYVEPKDGEAPLGSSMQTLLAEAELPGPVGKPYLTLHPHNGVIIVIKGNGGNQVFRIATPLIKTDPVEVYCASGLGEPDQISIFEVKDEIHFESLIRYPVRLVQQKKALAKMAK